MTIKFLSSYDKTICLFIFIVLDNELNTPFLNASICLVVRRGTIITVLEVILERLGKSISVKIFRIYL